jgi:hypothetical protein
MRYLVLTPYLGLWYPKGAHFELIGYYDADYTGCKVDRKSTSETCQFLGRSLVCWSSKKQNSVALSMAEAEYVAAENCCAQLLWMRQTLKGHGYTLNMYLSYVTMIVPSRLLTTLVSILEPKTLTLGTTS